MTRGISIADQRALQMYGRSMVSASIPDATIAHYDATKLNLSEGDMVNQWPDPVGLNTLQTGNAGTYRESKINGMPAVEFGSGEYLRWSGNIDFLGDEFCIMFVMTDPGIDSGNHMLSFREGGKNEGVVFRFRDEERDVWLSTDGIAWDPPTSPSVNGINMQYNGNLLYDVRYNSNQETGSWSQTFPPVQMGVPADADGTKAGTNAIGEIVVCNLGLSTREYDAQIKRLADKWGI